jgi:hypothetical protein
MKEIGMYGILNADENREPIKIISKKQICYLCF